MSIGDEDNTDNFIIKPIGFVRSAYKEASLIYKNRDLQLNEEILTKTRTGKEHISELVINHQFKDCLNGIEDFSHIIVLYWSHKINEKDRNISLVHPAGKKEYPLVGVFATRSPVRPNPILSTTVELLERKENILVVKGLDALDGSPLLDIKFHNPSYDAPENVKLPDWMVRLLSYFRNKTRGTEKQSS